MAKIKFTEASVSKLPLNKRGKQSVYYDSELPGFAVSVGASHKSYIVHTDINGKSAKITICNTSLMPLKAARLKAVQTLCDIKAGIDPRAQKKIESEKTFTIRAAFDEYIKSKKLANTTVRDYKEVIKLYIPDWSGKCIHSITPTMISDRHKKIGNNSGHATANRVMKYLRAVFNWCRVYHNLTTNPVECLSLSRSWYRVNRKTSYLKLYDMKKWWLSAQEDTEKDFLMWLLYTGMRRGESLKMKWEHFDFIDKTFVIVDPKNHKDAVLPLTDELLTMLKGRRELIDSVYVFPGIGKTGHRVDPKKCVARIEKACGLKINFHDLRRTYASIAESLDIPYYALKSLLNHSTGSDVTSGYIQMTPERLRKPSQKIATYISNTIGHMINEYDFCI